MALKHIILKFDNRISQERKYQLPFFYFEEKKLILGFVADKTILPVQARIKQKDQIEMIQIDPNKDLTKEIIISKLQEQIH